MTEGRKRKRKRKAKEPDRKAWDEVLDPDDTLAELDNLPDPDIDNAPEGGGSIRA